MPMEAKYEVTASSQALRALQAQIGNRSVPNRQVATQLYAEVMHYFDSQGNAGVPWAPLAPSTLRTYARKGEAHPRILERTGHLRASWLPFSDDEVAGVGARSAVSIEPEGVDAADLAIIHELGTDHIPARPMLPSRERGLEIAMQVYNAYIARAAQEASA